MNADSKAEKKKNQDYMPPKIVIPFSQALKMVRRYATEKLFEQLVAAAFISLYLLAFQIIVLRVAPADAVGLSLGMGCVVVGLSAFIEGLILGVMPVGENCGLRLPQAVPLVVLLVFAFAVGYVATIAEPAVGVLKSLGSHVNAWEAPLLFTILNARSGGLVRAIGIGMGSAVFAGVLRYYYRLSLKPFLFIVIPAILAVSVYCFMNPKTALIISLAWDAGNVATGPVTVPLILALGLGISRTIGGGDQGASGFGVVTLASALPILAVLIYGIILAPGIPEAAEKGKFFAPDKKEKVLSLFADKEEMAAYANSVLSPAAARAFLGDDYVPGENPLAGAETPALEKKHFLPAMAGNFKIAAQAIITLVLLLLVVLFILNRGKVHNFDEILLGVALSIIGMAFFSFGIDEGLSKLGDSVGRNLPTAYRAVPALNKQAIIPEFNEDLVQTAVTPAGKTERIFLLDEDGNVSYKHYDPARYNKEDGTYTYIPDRGPIFGGMLGGYIAILVFAFFMGVTATMAEPALSALAVAVEDATVGTYKRNSLIRTVAMGVGAGMSVGLTKILYDVPIIYYIVPGFGLLLLLSAFSSEDFVNIAWDSAGVTTGPITVPLVISLGLGIGGETGVIEGFGVIAIVSIFPVLFVLAAGIALTFRRRAAVKD